MPCTALLPADGRRPDRRERQRPGLDLHRVAAPRRSGRLISPLRYAGAMAASEERDPVADLPPQAGAATGQGVTYADYLALDRILDAQHPIAPEDLGPGVHAAEHFFITVH